MLFVSFIIRAKIGHSKKYRHHVQNTIDICLIWGNVTLEYIVNSIGRVQPKDNLSVLYYGNFVPFYLTFYA